MIKTDKVVYRTRTQEEYDWLMDKLGEAGCRWYFGQRSIDCNDTWETYESETCILVEDEKITYMSLTCYKECIDEFKNYDYIEVSDIMGQPYKDTKGKPELSLVPPQIIFDIAQVREYGNVKYPEGGKDNWKKVDINDYKDALLRHTLKYLQDPKGKDEESGIEHYKHMACNIAFICEMERKDEQTKENIMTDTEILALFLRDCTADFICDELAPSKWCENHCGKGQKRPDIECLRKYYEEN